MNRNSLDAVLESFLQICLLQTETARPAHRRFKKSQHILILSNYNEVNTMNKLFSQFLNPPKMISIILILVVLFIIYYFGPGIIKSLYEVGYQTGNAISSWVK